MHKRLFLTLIILLIALSLSACSSTGETPTPQPTGSSPQPVPTVLAEQPVQGTQETAQEPDHCLTCHSSQEQLVAAAAVDAPMEDLSTYAAFMVGSVEPMEAWQKVLVDSEVFPGSIHGLKGCISCHGGQNSPEKEAAHAGIVRNPSAEPQAVCGTCHPDVTSSAPHSLHATNAGFFAALDERSLPASHPELNTALSQSCASCHTTCGDCHVSRPALVGGGFVGGHNFQRTPNMEQNCAVCHGRSAGNEFLGRNEGLAADVHFSAGGMVCASCHTSHEIHGKVDNCMECHPGPESTSPLPRHTRLAGVQSPRCESCHTRVSAGQDDILYHQMHGSKLACQVCHSVEYVNCTGCHVENSGAAGQANVSLDESFLGLMIGRNPVQSFERPYEYVTLRHVPISADTFQSFGANLLQNFDAVETWKYAVPHNIQRKTPQTESCNACHGNAAIFLTADKLSEAEQAANQDVIVPQPPAPISADTQFP